MRTASFILVLMFAISCEMVTQIEIPEEPRKAIINSIFTPDSTWLVIISTTTPIQGIRHGIFEPQVTLTDETGQQIPLTLDDDVFDPAYQGIFGAAKFRSTTRPQPGMTYTIRVRGSNVAEATATARTPDQVSLIDAKLDSANMIAGNDEYSLAIPIEFTFDDPPGQGDYYFPIMTAQRESSYNHPITGELIVSRHIVSYPLSHTPPNSDFFGDSPNVSALSDVSFDGERHTAKMYVLTYEHFGQEEELDSVRFYLSHAKEEYFRYFQSFELHNRSRDNPFAEPVQVYTNIEGGLGIFAGSTPSYWDF